MTDVLKMQTRSRFIQNIKCFTSVFFPKFCCQLYSLCFSPTKGCSRLAELDAGYSRRPLVAAAGNTAMQSVMPSIGTALKVEDFWISLAYTWSALLWVLTNPLPGAAPR